MYYYRLQINWVFKKKIVTSNYMNIVDTVSPFTFVLIDLNVITLRSSHIFILEVPEASQQEREMHYYTYN
jgi:hypothetical protein